MQYTDSYSELLLSFASNINTTEGGTHETGFKAALTRVLNDYGKKYKLLKDDESFKGEDAREGLTAIISVKLQEAQFEGQDQDQAGQQRNARAGGRNGFREADDLLRGEPAGGPHHHRKRRRPPRVPVVRPRKKAREMTRRKVRTGFRFSAGQAGGLHRKVTRPIPKSTSSRVIPQAAPPRKAATAVIRRSCRCAGKMLNVEKGTSRPCLRQRHSSLR